MRNIVGVPGRRGTERVIHRISESVAVMHDDPPLILASIGDPDAEVAGSEQFIHLVAVEPLSTRSGEVARVSGAAAEVMAVPGARPLTASTNTRDCGQRSSASSALSDHLADSAFLVVGEGPSPNNVSG